MESIKCLHPVIILAKRVFADFRSAGATDFYIEVKGRVLYDSARGDNPYLMERNSSYLSPWRYGVKSTELQYCYYRANGRWYPLYFAVGCGKCALCRAQKREDWSTRCLSESASSASLPVFLTPTYNEENCPWVCRYSAAYHCYPVRYNKPIFDDFKSFFCVRTVLKSDFQKMMKRMRKAIELLPDGERWMREHPLRYLCVPEYGKKGTRRPHFHIILWNFPPPRFFNALNDDQYIYRVRKWIHEGIGLMPIWDKCDFARLDFDYVGVKTIRDSHGRPIKRITSSKGNSKGTAKYVAKYVSKTSQVPYGARPCKIMASNRNGGIGTKLLKRDIAHYRIIGNSDFFYFSDAKILKDYKCIMPACYKKILFPCPSYIRRGKRTQILEKLYWMYHRFVTFHSCFTGAKTPKVYSLDELLYGLDELFNRLFRTSPLDMSVLKNTYWDGRCLYPDEVMSSYDINNRMFFARQMDEDNYNLMLSYRDELSDYVDDNIEVLNAMLAELPLLKISSAHARYVNERYINREYDVEYLNKVQENFDSIAELNNSL